MSKLERRHFLKLSAAAFTVAAAIPSRAAQGAASGSSAYGGNKPLLTLSAGQFGLHDDAAGDQSAALIRLRDYMISDRSKHYLVQFQPGTYRYTNNRWLMGVGSVTIEANGCTFTNILDSSGGQNTRPLNTNSIFQDHGDQFWPGDATYHGGYPLRSIDATGRTVEFATKADAGRFAVNARVLVHSFDQQWNGYPPNVRAFEWRRVAAVDGSAGTVTFDAPLRLAHDGAMRDTAYPHALSIGRARVMLLDRQRYYYPEYIEFLGATFSRNPTCPAGDSNGLAIAADTLVLQDCRHWGKVWPTENRLARYQRCHFETVEGDKICDRVEFSQCVLDDAVVAATGVNDLYIEDCDVSGYIAVSPRRAHLARNRIAAYGEKWGAIRSFVDSWPVELLECTDNEIAHDASLQWAINAGPARQFTAAGRSSSNEILLADTAANRDQVIRQISVGTRLALANGSASGTVTQVRWTGKQWALRGNWINQVIAGQVWEFCNVQAVRESGTTFVGGNLPTLRPLDATQRRL